MLSRQLGYRMIAPGANRSINMSLNNLKKCVPGQALNLHLMLLNTNGCGLKTSVKMKKEAWQKYIQQSYDLVKRKLSAKLKKQFGLE